MMEEKNISVLLDCDVRTKGDTRMEAIYFIQGKDKSVDKMYSKQGADEYFINPDVVIVENGVGDPKMDLTNIVDIPDDNAL